VGNQHEEFLEAIHRLFYWQYGSEASFSGGLYSLFQKADISNRAKLKRGFPHEHEAWTQWNAHRSQDEFFAQFGLKRPEKDEDAAKIIEAEKRLDGCDFTEELKNL
jgi:hypothetical protein